MNYRDTSKKYHYYDTTQGMANILPENMLGRQYKYSVYQQILNTYSIQMNELREKQMKHLGVQFVQTYPQNTIDVIYTVNASAAPTSVQGKLKGSTETLSKSPYTNYEDWWYNTVPTNVKTITTLTGVRAIIDNQPLQPRFDFSTPDILPGVNLYITLNSDESQFINDVYNENILSSKITIYGVDKFNKEVEETYNFYLPGYRFSKTQWKLIYRVDCVGWDKTHLPLLTIAPYTPFDTLVDTTVQHTTPDRKTRDLHWTFDGCKLIKQVYASDILNYHAGIKDKEDVATYLLYKNATQPLTDNILSILPAHNSNFIYVLTANQLLCYSKHDEYTKLAGLSTNLKTPDPAIGLDVELLPGEIHMKGIPVRLTMDKRVVKYKFSIYDKEEGYLYWNGTAWSETDTFLDYKGSKYLGFASTIVLKTIGTTLEHELMIRLDIQFENGSIETDTYIVDAQIKHPIFAFDTTLTGTLVNTHNGFIGLYNDTAHTLSILDFENSTYMYDDIEKLLVFKEPFTEVTIDASSTKLVPQPFNVFSPIDHHAALYSVERPLGTKAYAFVDTIIDTFINRPGNTQSGLIYHLSRKLNIPIEPAVSFTVPTGTKLSLFENVLYKGSTSIDLYKDNPSISELVSMLNSTSVICSILNSKFNDYPATTLLNYNNSKYIKGLTFNKSTMVSLQIPYGWSLLPDTISVNNYTLATNSSDLSIHDDKKYLYINNNTISFNYPLSYDDTISYRIEQLKFNLNYFPISLVSGDTIIENETGFDSVSVKANSILNAIDYSIPTKWSI